MAGYIISSPTLYRAQTKTVPRLFALLDHVDLLITRFSGRGLVSRTCCTVTGPSLSAFSDCLALPSIF